MKRKLIVRHGRKLAMAVCGLLMGSALLQSCEDDLLTGQPSWLGNSIYERLSDDPDGQKYTVLLRLVDDLGQTEVLNHTGSKTIFAADDEAFERWFRNNSWGVQSYDQLSLAQKKLLLNTSMLNNAYLIELLSNASGDPVRRGMNMRRLTATSIYDTVSIMRPEQMPNTSDWETFRNQNKSVYMFKDATAAPIIHFLPEFMRSNGFTEEDIYKLTNGRAHSVDSSWINGVRVTHENITCKNGYIHKVADVVEPVQNIAEILRSHPSTTHWAQLIDRFSAPYYNSTLLSEYNRLYQTNYLREDSMIFNLRYFSNISEGRVSNSYHPNGVTQAEATLIYDPGWNQYMYQDPDRDMHYDAAAMLAPTNDVLDAWWNNSPLKTRYKVWDSVPQSVLVELLNNNMIEAFVNTIPSKFDMIVDDAQVRMGIQPEDVDSCFIGCNGVVYMTNKLFAPSSFASVLLPAMVNENMSIMNWTLDNSGTTGDNIGNRSVETSPKDVLNFKPLLNSMEATYSLLLPTNDAMTTYRDPCNYGTANELLFRFYYDDKTSQKAYKVKAERYQLERDRTTGQLTRKKSPTSDPEQDVINNRLKDLVNMIIIIGTLSPEQEYYKTRGGSVLRIKNAGTPSMTVEGGYQIENNQPIMVKDTDIVYNNNLPIAVTEIYDQTKETNGTGNGKSYRLESGIPMATTKSCYNVLKEHSQFSEFYNLLNTSDSTTLLTTTMGSSSNTKYCNNDKGDNRNISLFEGYNYTVYVPTNSVIQDLIAREYLPTWSDVAAIKDADWALPVPEGYADLDKTKKDSVDKALKAKQKGLAYQARVILRNRINDFVRYHIQDNSVFINGDRVTNGLYETSKLNPENSRFFSLTVSADQSNLSVSPLYVMDANGDPQPCIDDNGNVVRRLNVEKGDGLYNLMFREYWNEGTKSLSGVTPGSDTDPNKIIFTVSDGVVHQINGAMFFSKNQMSSWKEEINKLKEANGIATK
ncbi:MAG: fasciclin domain-containing protein [Prevotella sp.]|nr:fasciclin domain-containing protein [Prevotella sp.]